jgi:hypothetical protein
MEATFSFVTPTPIVVMIGGLAAITGMVWILYRKTTVTTGGRLKVLLIALRTSVLAVLALCLLQPMLISSVPLPRQSDVAVIVDDSRSMTIQDTDDGRSRGDLAVDLLYGENGLLDRLNDDFQLHTFRVGVGTYPLSLYCNPLHC